MMLTKKFFLVATFLLSTAVAAPYHNSYSENVAPLVSSESAQVIPDSYIIVFKKHIDEVKVKYHHTCVHDYVSEEKRSLSKRGLLGDFISGIKHTFDFDNFQGYSGRFSQEILDKIRRSDEVNILLTRETINVIFVVIYCKSTEYIFFLSQRSFLFFFYLE
jgi:cerevisin